jgi:N-methylhydantoinase B/oxoprolinase/acetone carboxylase alpha subunit
MDGISLEVLYGKLSSISEEMQLIILKSAHSRMVNEACDATSALLDAKGRNISQAVSIPIHLGCLTVLGKLLADTYPQGKAQEGDCYIVNDPYSGGTHLPDIAIASPAFIGSKLIGYATVMIHHQDIGGLLPGSASVYAHDLYSEGLRIKLTKIVEAGDLNSDLLGLMKSNSRTPETLQGDLLAQIAAGTMGATRMTALASEYGIKSFNHGVETLLDYTEKLTREEIRNIPDGEYEFEDWVDNDGSIENSKPLKIFVKMIVDNTNIKFDFEGSSPQVKTAINNVPSSATSAVMFGIRTLTGDKSPDNEGGFRPLSINFPEGSIVNPTFPAPVASRSVSLRRVVDVILGVLSKALPDRYPAANCGQASVIYCGTIDDNTNQRIVGAIGGPWMGGMGARPGKDGIDTTDHDASNVYHVPLEVSEAELPIRFNKMQLWTDSGGPGKWRGGLGFYSEVEWLRGKATASLRRDRHKFRPWGLAGGYPGPECKTALKKKNTVKGKIIPGKSQIELNEGDILQLWTTGSGGHSDPLERDEKLVLDDYLNNKISFSAVKDIYGVVIEANKVDLDKTKRLRQKLVG